MKTDMEDLIGKWSVEKLEPLRKYLSAYTILKVLMPPGFEDLNGVGLELVVSGKGLAEVHHPFGLLVAKRTATCRFSKLIAFLENL